MTATTTEQVDTLAERMIAHTARQDHPRARAVADAIATSWRKLRRSGAVAAAPTLNLDDTEGDAPRQHWQDGARAPHHGRTR